MKKILIICLLILIAGVGYSQEIKCGEDIPEELRAFKSGEKLKYGVKYSAAFFNVSVADIDFITTSEWYEGKDCYRINAVARTKPFFNFFFKMEDTYDSWIEKRNLRPLMAIGNIKEGAYRFRSTIDYNWANKTVYTEGKNLKSDYWSKRTMDIKPCSLDALSMFFNLRCADLKDMKAGDSKMLDVVFEDTIHTIRLKFLGRENRKIEDFGMFKTLKFTCQLATSDGESFKDGDEFLVWLSDDRNRIPLYLESPIRVGKVFATIEDYDGLRYPMTAWLK